VISPADLHVTSATAVVVMPTDIAMSDDDPHPNYVAKFINNNEFVEKFNFLHIQ